MRERSGKHMARALVRTPPAPDTSSGEGVQHKHTLEAEFVQTNGCWWILWRCAFPPTWVGAAAAAAIAVVR